MIRPKVPSRLTDKAFLRLPTQTSVCGKNKTRTLRTVTHYCLKKKNNQPSHSRQHAVAMVTPSQTQPRGPH